MIQEIFYIKTYYILYQNTFVYSLRLLTFRSSIYIHICIYLQFSETPEYADKCFNRTLIQANADNKQVRQNTYNSRV